MAKRKPKGTRRRTGPRASWKGDLTFGLVSFGVEAFNAIDRQGSDVHFHQLHSVCHSRIQHRKVCPLHGEVASDEIVSGFEVRKGEYVEVEPDELDALRTRRERALRIDAFISPGEIDPLYFDGRMYYLVSDGESSQEPFTVLLAAMEQEERVAVGRIVFSGKEQVVLVRPLESVLHMAMLNFHAEIRPPEKVAVAAPKPAGISRQVRLARTLVKSWADDSFDFSSYEDTYRSKVKELIQAKVKGREIVAPVDEEEPQVVSLMEALRKSLRQGAKRKAKSGNRRRRA